MARTKSSSRWLDRQRRDPYVKQARQAGYRSRAAYKLAELDKRDKLLRPGLTVVDLGAAPGGWSQYARERLGASGRIIALDVLPMGSIPGVEIIQGDFTENTVLHLLEECLEGRKIDLVISDMAPNISGVALSDQARSVELAELALDFADQHLKPGGALVVKIFQGEGFPALHKAMQSRFEKCVTRKPPASRAESREVYLLGKGFKGGAPAAIEPRGAL